MQVVSDELHRLIASKLKLGEGAKPKIRIEVDKLAFIPGRCTQLEFLVNDVKTIKRVEETWIEPSATGSIDGSSLVNSSTMLFPVFGGNMASMTSPYGYRSLGGGSMHKGIDFGIPVGTPLVASWSGVVSRIRTDQPTTSWGHYVVIRHSDGMCTKYCHMSKILVKVGEQVGAGKIIGNSGNSGMCYSGGKLLTDATRKAGKGAHLHFEVWKGCSNPKVTDPFMDGGFGATHVDPAPYLKHLKKMTTNSVNVGAGATVGTAKEGYEGEVKFKELFSKIEWHDNYTKSANFNYYKTHVKEGATGWAGFMFSEANVKKDPSGAGKKEVSFSKTVVMLSEGTLSLKTRANFKPADGDALLIYVNGKVVRKFSDFKNNKDSVIIKDIYIPKGTVLLKVAVEWGGKYLAPATSVSFGMISTNLPKMLTVTDMHIKSVVPKEKDTSTDAQTGGGYWSKQVVEDFVFNNKMETVQLEVGDFVYDETLIVENVQTCEVNISLEQECSEASFTIGNPNGFFNPDYAPYNFPELFHSSPWSYRVNGMQVGVFSENTPVRIYMGYGNSMIRVFTGLIDKIDTVGNEGTMTISARDMYKRVVTKVLTEEKGYPRDYTELTDTEGMADKGAFEKVAWLKTAVAQDLVEHAGLFGWRQCAEDLLYPDAVVEESYLIEVNQATGKVIKAIPEKQGEFESVDISSIPTPQGWLNPYVEEYGKKFTAFTTKVADCINDVIKDTNYRSYCDRYGTYRLEQIDYQKGVVGEFSEYDNLITINKSIDYVRGRSHILVKDTEGGFGNFVDKELLLELKGEVRTAIVEVPWAKTDEARKEVATRMFYDMKRLCRTLQVSIPGNPILDILDRIIVTDKTTATRDIYTIKGIRHAFNVESGYICVVDLMWSKDGTVI